MIWHSTQKEEVAERFSVNTETGLTSQEAAARLEKYGGVNIVNLYSLLTNKLNFRWNSDEELNDSENDNYIKKAVEECKTVVFAWGKAADNNQRIAERAEHVVAMLFKYKDKLKWISDGYRVGLHPLTPTLRTKWKLVPITESKDTDSKESVLAV